jgi:hypothetical protein
LLHSWCCRHSTRWAGCTLGSHAGWRHADHAGQAGRQAGRQADRQAGSSPWVFTTEGICCSANRQLDTCSTPGPHTRLLTSLFARACGQPRAVCETVPDGSWAHLQSHCCAPSSQQERERTKKRASPHGRTEDCYHMRLQVECTHYVQLHTIQTIRRLAACAMARGGLAPSSRATARSRKKAAAIPPVRPPRCCVRRPPPRQHAPSEPAGFAPSAVW